MNIVIGRHNGIGDLIMATPFIGHYLSEDHQVTVMTEGKNHAFLKWIFPRLITKDIDVNPYTDYRTWLHGYDKYLNFNRVEGADYAARDLCGLQANQQQVYALLASIQGLSIPTNLSPSHWTSQAHDKAGPVMIFTQSTHPSRRIEQPVLDRLLMRYPGAVVDPRYDTQVQFAEHVARSRLVVAPDSGAIHVAEIMSTPWICLHTTMTHPMRHLFYRHGRSIQSSLPCSPCLSHVGCDNIQCTSNFNLETLDGE